VAADPVIESLPAMLAGLARRFDLGRHVSIEGACRDYGVVTQVIATTREHLQVDLRATERRRAELISK
jgi:hypothetical protein